MGTPNYYQESLESRFEILLEKRLSTEAGNKTKHDLRAEARWRIKFETFCSFLIVLLNTPTAGHRRTPTQPASAFPSAFPGARKDFRRELHLRTCGAEAETQKQKQMRLEVL